MRSKTQAALLAAPAALLLMLSLTACGDDTAAGGGATSGEGTTSAEGSEAPETSDPTPAVGVPLVDGDIEFVVNSVTCTTDPMSDSTYAPLSPKGQFCLVNVSATALDDIGMYLGEVTIDTKNGSTDVSPSVGASMYEGTLGPDYIDNGQTLEGNVVFDIALDDAVASVTLKENPLTSGVVVPITQ